MTDKRPESEWDNYVPSWRKTSRSLGGTPPPPVNDHLPQLYPDDSKRNPALDRLIAMKRSAEERKRTSGHSLIRPTNRQARFIDRSKETE